MLLPTTVVGSHAFPGWLCQAEEAIQQGRFAAKDIEELRRDAVLVAVHDQETAGVDVITDGEMGRLDFNLGFYSAFPGLRALPSPRLWGPPGHDQRSRYEIEGELAAPDGLGVVAEFTYLKSVARRAVKATVPGPYTLAGRLVPNSRYPNRRAIAEALAPIVRNECLALVEAGAETIQVDEPSFACYPAGIDEYVELFNATVAGVKARIATHLCFGNYKGRAVGKRVYRPLFPKVLDLAAGQFLLEFAGREMAETDLWREFAVTKELAAGVVDVKSYYIETPEDVAGRIRLLLRHVPADRLWITADCGLSQTARWAAIAKLRNMVEGARVVRAELTGQLSSAKSRA
jgi:5-methyltetrahydropteroyltriglutamate--homocysteine methyltransferase